MMESFRSNKGAFLVKAAIVACVMIMIGTGLWLKSNHKIVVIAHDGEQIEVATFKNTVEEVLEKKEIVLHAADKIQPKLTEKIEDGTEIVIERAFEVKVVDAGVEKTLMTTRKSVEALLSSLGTLIHENDIVTPVLNMPLVEGQTITIMRISEKYESEKIQIPYQTVTKHNGNLEIGELRKVRDGNTGVKEIKVRIVYENGVEVKREVVEETILADATDEVFEKGTKNFIVTSRGEVQRFKEVIIMVATAYTAGYESTGKNPGDHGFGITKSGTQVRPGVVAVDPRVIPLGTQLYIESLDSTVGYGKASAEDIGGSIRGNRIDLFFECVEDAIRFGRRKVRVYVLDN
ncbi:MAG: 3D domain-containing protein [Alkaliphilus sp.]